MPRSFTGGEDGSVEDHIIGPAPLLKQRLLKWKISVLKGRQIQVDIGRFR